MRRFLKMHHPAAKWTRTIVLSALVGVAAGLAAAALHAGLRWGASLVIGRFAELGGPEVLQFRWPLLLLPAVGGLASGLVVQWIARLAPEQGTDLLVRVFHYRDGHMSLGGPLTKATAAVGVISFGGSAGPEGPIAALGAAIGSTVGRYFHLTPRDRRILLVAGCAGGVGAIFGCPLGGALFAASVLYRQPEFESNSLVSAFIASVVSYSTFMGFHGYGEHLLRNADQLTFISPIELPIYLALGVLCGASAMFFSLSLGQVERVARRLRSGPFPAWIVPAIGGLATGALACALPQVVDGEYRTIQNVLDGSLFGKNEGAPNWFYWSTLLGLIVLGKCVATAFTVGSGASGGVLGPSVFIGGAVGAFAGALLEALFPGTMPESLRESMIPVGMAGVLSAAMRTPLAAMVMVTEMTGSYGLIVPLMLVTMIAYVVGGRWGLIQGQVRSSADSPAHAGDAVVNLLESYRVRDLMERDWPYRAEPSTTLGELLATIKSGTRPYFTVLKNDRLVGLLSVNDIRRLAQEEIVADVVIAADIMTDNLYVIDPDETLYQALGVFQERRVEVLPVVPHRNDGRLVGMLSRQKVYDLVQRHLVRMRKELLREHAGLAAIEQDSQMNYLLSGMPQENPGSIERMAVPGELVGSSLRQANFRNVYHCEVLAIQTEDGSFVCPPDPGRPLRSSDRLIVLTST